jgi:hypothetical protein
MTMDASSVPLTPAGGSAAGAVSIDGRDAFTAALHGVLTAPPDAVRELWLVDEQFVGWPLDDAAVIESLGRWLRQGNRRLHIVGADFAAVAWQYPKFTRWRRDYSHAISAWQPLETECADWGALWLCDVAAIELLDREHWRARLVRDPAAVRALAERMDTLLHRCQPAWPSTTLGL